MATWTFLLLGTGLEFVFPACYKAQVGCWCSSFEIKVGQPLSLLQYSLEPDCHGNLDISVTGVRGSSLLSLRVTGQTIARDANQHNQH